MGKTKTTRYDVAEHLRTPKEMAAYLEACLEEANGDAAFIAKALGDIARAKGMAQVARDANLSRESLYKALSGERSPSFDTILKVMAALGLKLHAEASNTDEAYFRTQEWQKGEAKADRDINKGDVLGPFADIAEGLKALKKPR